MGTVIFDIETNGLLEQLTKIYVIACKDADGTNEKVFTTEDCGDRIPDGNLKDGVKHLMGYDRIVAHNFMGFDTHVLNRFFPNLWNTKTVPFDKHWDTFVQSKCQHFDRPRIKGQKGNHGLAYYGDLFKFPKPSIEDWTYWDAAKLNRCLVDIEINRKAYIYLNNEAEKTGLDFTEQILRTQEAQFHYAHQEMTGWYGDKEHMRKCVVDLDGIIDGLRNEIEHNLPKQVKPKAVKATWEDVRDKWEKFYRKVPKPKMDMRTGKVIKESYIPTTKVFLKNGLYDKHTASHFGISQEPDESDRLVRGAHTRIEIFDSKMSQHAIVKDYLLSEGWQPTQWNYQKDSDGKLERDDRGNMIKKSAKLTEDSFGSIKGGLGKKIANYNTYIHRRRTFENEKDGTKGWLNQIREDGRISAGALCWQSSTGRSTQTKIVNCPSNSALYGWEMRKTWTCEDDKILVSVDQDSAQLRLLANFMGDEEFTKSVVEGEEFDADHNYVGTDAHSLNSRLFGLVSDEDWVYAVDSQDGATIKKIGDARKISKNGIYALLFGSGQEKFANVVGYKTAAQGKKVMDNYFERLPKVKNLIDGLKEQWLSNKFRGGGYIETAGGVKVWCGSEHKMLNYLLMGSEATLQNEAINWVNEQMKVRGLNGKQLGSFHDELTFEFPLNEEKEGIQLMSEMYGEASKRLGLEVLVTGTAQSGKSWAEIH